MGNDRWYNTYDRNGSGKIMINIAYFNIFALINFAWINFVLILKSNINVELTEWDGS